MKRFSIKFLSLILVIAMLLSISSISAAAISNEAQQSTSILSITAEQLAEYDEIEAAREAYNNLCPEAQEIFNQMLAIDPTTRAYHIANVDSTYSAPLMGTQTASTAVAASTVTSIVSQLNALGLPTAVVYSLESVASGIVAALADGPLPFGDALLLVATVGATIVVAANWDSISSKWTSIVNIFKNTFTSISTIIQDTFGEIKESVPTHQNIPTITLSGKVAIVAGVQYNCQVMVSAMTQSQKQNNYYVAVLVGGNVFFDASRPISQALARTIVAVNRGNVGIVATSSARALVLAQPAPIGPEIHGGGATGYYWHYHNAMYRNCHIWYV